MLLTVSLAAFAAPAFAQTAAEPVSGAATTAPETSGIGDIVVNAQRREERLQTEPVAITAIDSKGLEASGIRDITRLEVLTPGLGVGQSGSDTPRGQTSLVPSYYLRDFNAFIERQDAYSKTDLRLTYTAPQDRFMIEGYAINLEDKAVKSGGKFGGRGAYFIAYAPPRQYGVVAGFKFES